VTRKPPDTMWIGGIKHKLVVFQITESDELGRPLVMRILKDEESVHLEGGEKFMTGYVRAHMIEGKSRKGEA
jgi:hypothetical protein